MVKSTLISFGGGTHGGGLKPGATTGRGRIFELTAKKMQWETEPGHLVDAWAYNEQVPGPQIRVREGDRVRVILHNQLPESTAVHFHGLELPNAMVVDALEPLREAVRVTVWSAAPAPVLAWKVALEDPPATFTVPGTVSVPEAGLPIFPAMLRLSW